MANERETEARRSARRAVDQAAIAIGAEFAGHRIDEELGRGGMGIVYRARHLSLDRERALALSALALKVIAPDLSRDERFRARFRREARAAAAIEHVAVGQTGWSDGGGDAHLAFLSFARPLAAISLANEAPTGRCTRA